jgi:hypothetical protein
MIEIHWYWVAVIGWFCFCGGCILTELGSVQQVKHMTGEKEYWEERAEYYKDNYAELQNKVMDYFDTEEEHLDIMFNLQKEIKELIHA